MRFVERQSLTSSDVIRAMTHSHRVVVSGLPGVGKTELVAQVIKQARSSTDYVAIFWLSATSRPTLQSELYELARTLGVLKDNDAGFDEIGAGILKELNKYDHWLMVLDNVDEIESIKKFLPERRHASHVIITTRFREAYLGLGGVDINLKAMSEIEATQLLLKSYHRGEGEEIRTNSSAAQLVIELGCLPLAIIQAALYLQATQESISGYMEIYKRERRNLWDWCPKQTLSYLSVGTVMLLSFQKLRPFDASIRLFCLLSFLEPDNIPESLWTTDQRLQSESLRQTFSSEGELNKALEPLLVYCFIQRSEARFISMHRLVQNVMRDIIDGSLKDSADVLRCFGIEERVPQYWIRRAIEAVTIAYPDPHFTNWRSCERLNPHAMECVKYAHKYELKTRELGLLLSSMGDYAKDRGRYRAALEFYGNALRIFEDESMTAKTLMKIGIIRGHQGMYDAAINIYERAFMIIPEQSAENPVQMSGLAHHLATALQGLSKHDDAVNLYQWVLEVEEKLWGPDNINIAGTVMNLGHACHKQGNYPRALEYHKRALAIFETAFGKDHILTADVLHNLGFTSHAQGKSDEALLYYKHALHIYANTFGDGHIISADTLENLGITYQALGQYDAALEQYYKSLKILEGEFGANHIYAAPKIRRIGDTFLDQKRYDQAILMFEKALQIYEQEFGDSNSKTIDTILDIGCTYLAQGQLEEARAKFLRVLAIAEQVSGLESEKGRASANLAGIYYMEKDHINACAQYEHAITIFQTATEPDSKMIARLLGNLGHVNAALGKHKEAIAHYEQALKRTIQKDLQNELTADLESDIGKSYSELGNYRKAITHYMKALKTYENVLGKDHIKLASVCLKIAEAYGKQDKGSLAVAQYERVISIRKKAYGEDHLDTACARWWLGNEYFFQGMYAEAKSEFDRVRNSAHSSEFEGTMPILLPKTTLAYYNRGRKMLKEFFAIDSTGYLHEALRSLQMAMENVDVKDPLRSAIIETLSTTSEVVEVLRRSSEDQDIDGTECDNAKIYYPGLGKVKLRYFFERDKPSDEWGVRRDGMFGPRLDKLYHGLCNENSGNHEIGFNSLCR